MESHGILLVSRSGNPVKVLHVNLKIAFPKFWNGNPHSTSQIFGTGRSGQTKLSLLIFWYCGNRLPFHVLGHVVLFIKHFRKYLGHQLWALVSTPADWAPCWDQVSFARRCNTHFFFCTRLWRNDIRCLASSFVLCQWHEFTKEKHWGFCCPRHSTCHLLKWLRGNLCGAIRLRETGRLHTG